MQLFIDYLPILVFFVTYVLTKDIFVAVTVLMVIAPIILIGQWVLTRKISKMYVASTALVLVLGGATLLYRDPIFLFWKPTVLYWIAALVFVGSQFVGERTIVQRMIEGTMKSDDAPLQLTTQQWSRLNLIWAGFFVITGCLNIYVAFNFSEATWVNFKLFGLLGLTLAFVIVQTIWLTLAMHKNQAVDRDPEI
jgi:intracellular septation protein